MSKYFFYYYFSNFIFISIFYIRSLYELGFMILGRSSIFYISACISVASFGLMLIYLITFSDIMASMVSQIFYEGKKDMFMEKRTFYVLLIGVLLLPLAVKKELKELKAAAVILFVGITAFILIFTF